MFFKVKCEYCKYRKDAYVKLISEGGLYFPQEVHAVCVNYCGGMPTPIVVDPYVERRCKLMVLEEIDKSDEESVE